MKLLLCILFVVGTVSAETLHLLNRGIYEVGGRGRDSVIVFDMSQGGVDRYRPQLAAFDNNVAFAVNPGTYSVFLASATKDGNAFGSSNTYTLTVVAGYDKTVTVVHDFGLNKPLVLADENVPVAASGGGSVNLLFLCLAAGFFFGWCLSSPLEL